MDQDAGSCFNQTFARRTALKAVIGAVVCLGLGRAITPGDAVASQDVSAPRNLRPREGDRLVFAEGDRPLEAITPKDLLVGGPRVMAFPIDPKTNVVKDGSRLNKVLLVRFDPESLAEETRARSADGIVAYSGVCTHQGCDVAAWQEDTKTFWCPCHESRFDPRNGARVVGGPAPKRLAALPLKLVEGALTVAGGFSGTVGPQTR
jgi:nitrite reductase/ring-hydroxylating ferredoxin subunit